MNYEFEFAQQNQKHLNFIFSFLNEYEGFCPVTMAVFIRTWQPA